VAGRERKTLGDRHRDRQAEKHRQRDRQNDRQANNQEKQTGGFKKGRHTYVHTGRQTAR